jgi:CubicO group peptidase (beta-lactamase class C family)
MKSVRCYLFPQPSPALLPRLSLLPLALATLFSLQGCAQLTPAAVTRSVQIASASTSQILCLTAFVSGLDPADTYRDKIRPAAGFGLIDWALNYEVDRERREVTTTIFGKARRRAVYREGLGCIIDFGSVPATTWQRAPVPNGFIDPFPSLAAPEVLRAVNPRIAASIDAAFQEPSSGPKRRTQAVVVVHRGQLIAERYADDVRIDTPLQGHSISKSVTHALIGRLAASGKIDADRAVDIPAWKGVDDPRARITPNQLLAMSSGLPWDEYAGGWDESTRMWFTEADPYAYSISVRAKASPGVEWNYSNLGYAVLSRLIRDKVSDGAARGVLDFAERELFAPLGMRTPVLNFDVTETPGGSGLFLASARDWARFGLLYLRGGAIGTQQILPADWVKAAIVPTLDAGYGRSFWLNHTDAAHPLPGRWGMKGAPADAYFARGYLGQFIVIVPSLDLVIVRLGISYRKGGDIDTVGQMVGEISAAVSR